MGVRRFINLRPLGVTGFIIAIHSIVYGIGYTLKLGGFSNTVLYHNIGDVVSPEIFGIALLILGTILAYGYAKEKAGIVKRFTPLQSIVWLFATLIYMLSGAVMLGIGVGLVWALLSGYVGYAFLNKDYIVSKLAIEQLDEDR